MEVSRTMVVRRRVYVSETSVVYGQRNVTHTYNAAISIHTKMVRVQVANHDFKKAWLSSKVLSVANCSFSASWQWRHVLECEPTQRFSPLCILLRYILNVEVGHASDGFENHGMVMIMISFLFMSVIMIGGSQKFRRLISRSIRSSWIDLAWSRHPHSKKSVDMA